MIQLFKIAKEMRLEDKKASELGLTEEYFYSVLSQNDSTKIWRIRLKELVHHMTYQKE